MCQSRFINCNEWTDVEGVLIIGEATDVWEQGVNRKCLPSASFITGPINQVKNGKVKRQPGPYTQSLFGYS